MRHLKNKARQLLLNDSGESLVEVLTAILISTCALIMLATAITSSTNMVRNSRSAMNRYYAITEELASPSDSSSEYEYINTGSKSVTLSFSGVGLTSGDAQTISVEARWSKDPFARETLVSYEKRGHTS